MKDQKVTHSFEWILITDNFRQLSALGRHTILRAVAKPRNTFLRMFFRHFPAALSISVRTGARGPFLEL
ncbi:hypothetical protein BKA01_005592 [Pseudonocardia eucalypti]|nr:hypothetical protein [Pseudonocardia eucalypti]